MLILGCNLLFFLNTFLDRLKKIIIKQKIRIVEIRVAFKLIANNVIHKNILIIRNL